ncbi:MAG: 2-dehydropantoate 2-reductase [Betaproteobacteria bacterium]|nr:2-dehydropantoate 2-reductase [Betaproteobacteria bacterium]
MHQAPASPAAAAQGPAAPTDWPRIGIFGAGAVGCYYGARLALAGAPVTLVGRGVHVQAMRAQGLVLHADARRQVAAVSADTDPAALADAEVVLFCVKSHDTDTGGRTLAPLLRPGAVLVSLQNGVDNPVRLRAAAGRDALAAAVYVACSMSAPGEVRHAGRGDLILGPVPGASAAAGLADAQRVAALFERAGVPCPVVPDARPALWEKLVMNCVFNALSALGRARYARLVADAGARALMAEVVAECVAVAASQGVPLPPAERLVADAIRLGTAMSGATSSMAQDLAAGRPTEIDALNGLVARLGEAAAVPVPVNRALSTLVRLAEAG